MSILRYSRKSVTEGSSEAPVLFPGFPGAMSGWGPGLQSSGGRVARWLITHRPLQSPPASSVVTETEVGRGKGLLGVSPGTPPPWENSPPLGYGGTMGCAPHAILSSSPQSACSCPNMVPGHAVMPRHGVRSREGLAGAQGASREEREATRWGKALWQEEGCMGEWHTVVRVSQ